MGGRDSLYLDKEMITKDILLTLTYLVGAGELILAAYFWINNSKSEIRRVMALFAFSAGAWCVTSALTSYISQTTLTLFYSSLVYSFAVLALAFLVHLVVIYPYPFRRFDGLHSVLFYIPTGIFVIACFVRGLIFTGIQGDPSTSGIVYPGSLYNFYNSYLAILFIFAVAIVFYRRKKFDGQHKRNSTIFLWSIFFGGLPALILDLIMPLFWPSILPNALYANIATGIWLGATTYIVMRK